MLIVPGTGAYANDAAPVPPCAGEPHPAFANVGAPLNVKLWEADQLPANWRLPACVGWADGPAKIVLAGAGTFSEPGGAAAILKRLANIDGLLGIKYWSNSREGWYPLFEDASALNSANRRDRRANFTLEELTPGGQFHFMQDEDLMMKAVSYKVTILERSDTRMVFETVNTSAMGIAIFNAVDAGQFHQYYMIEKRDGDIWRYYTLARLGKAGMLAALSVKSFKNRAVAYYRYLAGIPTDRGPPAAP